MIWSTTPGPGLYLASSRRSLANEGSSVGYGRYSSTSRAQRAAFEMPAVSNARWSSATLAVFALTFDTEAGEAAAPGDAAAPGEAPVTVADGGVVADVGLDVVAEPLQPASTSAPASVTAPMSSARREQRAYGANWSACVIVSHLRGRWHWSPTRRQASAKTVILTADSVPTSTPWLKNLNPG